MSFSERRRRERGRHERLGIGLDAKLLLKLAGERRLGELGILQLPSRKFPESGHGSARGALLKKNPPFIVD